MGGLGGKVKGQSEEVTLYALYAQAGSQAVLVPAVRAPPAPLSSPGRCCTSPRSVATVPSGSPKRSGRRARAAWLSQNCPGLILWSAVRPNWLWTARGRGRAREQESKRKRTMKRKRKSKIKRAIKRKSKSKARQKGPRVIVYILCRWTTDDGLSKRE